MYFSYIQKRGRVLKIRGRMVTLVKGVHYVGYDKVCRCFLDHFLWSDGTSQDDMKYYSCIYTLASS